MTLVQFGTKIDSPDLTSLMLDALNATEVGGKRLTFSPGQLEVLKQTTVAVPSSDSQRPDAVSSCHVAIHNVEAGDAKATALFLASHTEAGQWGVAVHQARSLPNPPPKPFDVMILISPYLGIAVGVRLFSESVHTLRAELGDGHIVEESASGGSLHLLLPIYSPEGWGLDEAPCIRLLDREGNDVIPPSVLPLRKAATPRDSSRLPQ